MIIGTCNEESYWGLPPGIYTNMTDNTKVIRFQLHWKVPNICTVDVVILYFSLLFKTCACNLRGLKVICVSNGGYHRLVKAAPFPFIIKKGGSDFPCLLFFIWITPRERLISHTSYHIRQQGGFCLFFLFSLFINFPTSLPFRLELGTNPSGHFRGLHALHFQFSGVALYVLQDFCFDITARNLHTTRDLNRAF